MSKKKFSIYFLGSKLFRVFKLKIYLRKFFKKNSIFLTHAYNKIGIVHFQISNAFSCFGHFYSYP